MAWLVEELVTFVHANGRRAAGKIAVGMPTQIDETEARCPVSLDGLEQIGIPACGSSPLQALLLGVQLLGYRLYAFQSRGGKVLHPDGDEVPLEALFGPLLRAAVAPEDNAGP